MGWGFFICQTDCKNRKRLTEFWLHKNFIGVHYHGWVDLNQKKLAESCTRHRKFKDNYYVAMETIIPFYENAIQCLTKDRLNPEFFLLRPIKEKKIIVYDDILTTGSTLLATYELLRDREQLLFLIGINNN